MWIAMLADLAVKSTLVLAVAWLAAQVLRSRSAAARHLCWTAAAAAVLALPFLTAWLPGLPVRAAGVLLPSAGVVFQTTATARAAATTGRTAQPNIDSAGIPSPGWRPDWPVWIAAVWITGAAVLLAQMLLACAAVWRLRRSAAPWSNPEVALAHGVEVLETPAGSMPMTFGILRPVVFLPSDAARWSDELSRAVLLHEVAHVRRGDVATQMLARLALTLHWWNPLAWTAWRHFLRERERAADDMVLSAGARASDYAAYLLQMARSRQSAPALAWAAVCMARRSQLESRLAAILDARASRAAAGPRAALAAAVAAVALVAPLAAVRAEKATQRAIAPVVNVAFHSTVSQQDRAEVGTPAPSVHPERADDRSVAYGVGLLKIANLEQSRHRGGEAESFYAKAAAVLGDRSEAAPAWFYLGMHKHDPEEAIACLRKAERLDPAQSGKARMWMAMERERQKRPADAETLYKSALSVEKPGSTEAAGTLHVYARFLRQQGRVEEAQAIEKDSSGARYTGVTTPGVYRVGNGVKPPALLQKAEPEYTEDARVAKFQGTVVIYAEIGTDGLAHNQQIVRGLGLGLDEKAMEAIAKWRFRPGVKDGSPVPVAATIEVNFRML
jgi:TonB family protein